MLTENVQILENSLFAAGAPDEPEMGRRLSLAVCASILLHLALILGINLTPHPPKPPLEVSLLSLHRPQELHEAKKTQREEKRTLHIAPPSDVPETAPPEKTEFLSDKNTSTEKQSVRRGMPEAGMPSPQPREQKKEAAKAAAPEKPGGHDVKHAMRLRLSEDELAAKLSDINRSPSPPKNDQGKSKNQNGAALDSSRVAKLQQHEPFRRSAPDPLFSGRAGVPDVVPNIPDGEITLLNAKADQHAVFVRRVALQVFGALRKMSWAEVPHAQLRDARGFATVYATMSKDGKLLSVELDDSSGSQAFDRILVQAAKKGTWDQNPPPQAAAKDGVIHFVFQARTWVRFSGETYRESRWLLLGTGLL
ncbi:MAG TPA: energy transducer TonB [Oligoflexia bacterium]|nr:energy transducer TonB [Oligoflexia bacterium]